MGFRSDFYRTMEHEQPQHVLIDFGGNPLSSMEGRSMNRLLEYLGYEAPEYQPLLFGEVRHLDERILRRFHVGTRSVGKIVTPLISQAKRISDSEYIDEWGIRRRFTGRYWDVVDHPLSGATAGDLDKFQWPDPESLDQQELQGFRDAAKTLFETTDYVICGEHPVYGIFELGCWMCGFSDFLMKMALDEEFIQRFFEKVLDYQKKVIAQYYGAVGPYIHYTSSGDDFATQTSTFVSREMFNRMIAPYFKERIRCTKEFTQAKFLHHSCGNIFSLIEDLIACGVEIINPIQPVQPEMQPESLKEHYGSRIVFHGGIDTQYLLPSGNRAEIEEAVQRTIEVLGKNGGYIFASAHNIQEDVPPENLVYMLDAANR